MANTNPDSRVVHLNNEFEEETEEILAEYGVGIDTHSKFIQVCVFVQHEQNVLRFEQEFTTDWADLRATQQWIQEILTNYSIDPTKFRMRVSEDPTNKSFETPRTKNIH